MNEVTLKKKNPCYKSRQRRPYAQLTTVELHKTFFKICVAMQSDLTPVIIDENGNPSGGLTSGFGCDAEKMQEITDELKKRQIGRGAVAQVKQQDFLISQTTAIMQKVPALLHAAGVSYPPEQAKMAEIFTGDFYSLYDGKFPEARPMSEVTKPIPKKTFDEMNWDVECLCEKICMNSKNLKAGPELLNMKIVKCAGMAAEINMEMAYGQVPAVNKKNVCCFRGVYIEGLNAANPNEDPTYWPGMGCSGELRDEIYDTIKERVTERGRAGGARARKGDSVCSRGFSNTLRKCQIFRT